MKTVLKLILVAFLLLFRGVEDGNGFKRILRTRKIRHPKKAPRHGMDCRISDRSPACNDGNGRKRRKI